MKENTLSQTFAAGQVAKPINALNALHRKDLTAEDLNAAVSTAVNSGGSNPHRPTSGLNSGKHLTGLTRLASLLLATLLLAACGGGGGSSSSSSGGASGIQVTNLKAIPGSRSLTLTWDNPNANISSFDIEVRNLATNERVVAASQVNRTISTSPAVNTTAPLAKVRYIIPSGLVDDSNYSVAVTVNLQGADAGRATSAKGLSGRRYLPANGVRIGANTDEDQYANSVDNCPAIENDDQANTYGGADNMGDVCGDFDSDTIVDADDNCAVVANTDQLDTNGNGMGDVCDPALDSDSDSIANDLDNCPFTASPNQEDGDMDNVGDICDVDDDGDGLIELSTAAELNMMRNNLNGTGFDADNRDNDNTTGGNSMGCGGGRNGDASACNGYEQMADIDLNALPDNAMPGHNWEPVGTCGSGVLCNVDTNAQLFSGTFSGNDFTISNMFINVATDSVGIGFFGAISPTAQLRNVHIRGGNITADTGVTSTAVGGLAGSGSGIAGLGAGATISNSSVTLESISGTFSVSGLVGAGIGATISNSWVTLTEIIVTSQYVGGLIGWGNQATISSSVAIVGSISGVGNIGGLAANGQNGRISSSVVIVGSIIGTSNVGGLVGDGSGTQISSSVATVGSIIGTFSVGGLVGDARGIRINSSMAVTNSITGTSNAGGLTGSDDPFNVTASYWDDKVRFVNATSNTVGSSQTTAALQTPVGFTGIYTTWANAWCNPTTGEFTTDSSSALAIDANRAWDLGTASEYPAITCVQNLFSLADQREASRRALAGELPLVD